MKISSFLLSSALILATIGLPALSCKKSTAQPDISKDIVLPAAAAPVIRANSNFAFDFLHADLLLDKNPGNKLISPFSIYLALSMVCNGAAQATQDSIRNALRLQNIDINDLNSTCLALIQQLPHADSKVTMSIANSIWYRQSIQPVPTFLDKVHSDYLATVQALNFNDPNAPNAINSWVSDHTQQKIPKIIGDIPGDELMLLIRRAIEYMSKDKELDSLRRQMLPIQAVQQRVAGLVHMDKPRHRQPLQDQPNPGHTACPGQPMNLPPGQHPVGPRQHLQNRPVQRRHHRADRPTEIHDRPRSQKYAPDHDSEHSNHSPTFRDQSTCEPRVLKTSTLDSFWVWWEARTTDCS